MAREIKAWAVVCASGRVHGVEIYKSAACTERMFLEIKPAALCGPHRVVALTGELREPARRAKGKEGRSR